MRTAIPLEDFESPAFVEKVAAEIHNKWLRLQESLNRGSYKTITGENLMVPWDTLSESAKDPNTRTVQTVFEAIIASENNEKRN